VTVHDPDRPGTPGEDVFREWDAAYVLGALSPSDRRLFEEHLASCAACRERVTELAGMPGVLRALTAQEGTALVDGTPRVDVEGADVVDLATVARSTRSARLRRRLVLAGAAAVLVVGAAFGGAWAARTVAPAPVVAEAARLELRPTGEIAVTADLTLQEKGWGTRLDWSCTYPEGAAPEGTVYGPSPVYELVLVEDDGTATVVATWSATTGHARGLGASSSVPAADIARVEIRVQGARDALAAAMV